MVSAIVVPPNAPARTPTRVTPSWTVDRKLFGFLNQVQGTPCPSIAVLRQVLKTHPTAESKATSDMAKIPLITASAMMMAISRPSVFIWAMR